MDAVFGLSSAGEFQLLCLPRYRFVAHEPKSVVRRERPAAHALLLRGMRTLVRRGRKVLLMLCAASAVLATWTLSPTIGSGGTIERATPSRESAAIVPRSVVDPILIAPIRVGPLLGHSTFPSWWQSLSNTRLVSYHPGANGPDPLAQSPIDTRQLDADLARIASLHANTVRLALNASVRPNSDTAARIQTFLQHAAAHGMRTQVTLFNLYSAYDIAWSKVWAAGMLARLAGDRRIAFVELQNEIDPSNAAAMTWARTLIPVVRGLLGGIPLTISEGGYCAVATNLAALKLQLRVSPPDFWDVHFYCPAAAAYTLLRRAVAIAAPLPVLIGESGYSTVADDPSSPQSAQGTAWQEAEQARFFQTVEDAAYAAGMPPAGVWLDSDISRLREPNTKESELHFGLFRLDGSPKPAAAVVAAAFQGVHGPAAGNFSFEQVAGDYPVGWIARATDAGTFARDPSVAHSGTASLSISNAGSEPDGTAPTWSLAVPQFIQPGQRYTASAWVRAAANDGTVLVSIVWRNGFGRGLGLSLSSALPSGDSGWTQLVASGVAPAGAAYAELVLESRSNQGTAWFDDASFR